PRVDQRARRRRRARSGAARRARARGVRGAGGRRQADPRRLRPGGRAPARRLPRAALDEVADDWADRWRAFHRGVRLGPLWVGPPWEAAPAGALPVVIDPGRAFGTGAHPTTRLCLELLLEQPPGALVDVGCGSGVLAIAAAKLGHGPVVALDVDP